MAPSFIARKSRLSSYSVDYSIIITCRQCQTTKLTTRMRCIQRGGSGRKTTDQQLRGWGHRTLRCCKLLLVRLFSYPVFVSVFHATKYNFILFSFISMIFDYIIFFQFSFPTSLAPQPSTDVTIFLQTASLLLMASLAPSSLASSSIHFASLRFESRASSMASHATSWSRTPCGQEAQPPLDTANVIFVRLRGESVCARHVQFLLRCIRPTT